MVNASHKCCPRSSINADNTRAVRDLVEGDRRITVAEIASEVGISVGSVHTILSDELGFSKGSARWIPTLLTEAQRNVRKYICRQLLNRFEEEGEAWTELWVHHYTRRTRGRVWSGRKEERGASQGQHSPVSRESSGNCVLGLKRNVACLLYTSRCV